MRSAWKRWRKRKGWKCSSVVDLSIFSTSLLVAWDDSRRKVGRDIILGVNDDEVGACEACETRDYIRDLKRGEDIGVMTGVTVVTWLVLLFLKRLAY